MIKGKYLEQHIWDKHLVRLHLGSRIKYISSRYGKTTATIVKVWFVDDIRSDGKGDWIILHRVKIGVQTDPNPNHSTGRWGWAGKPLFGDGYYTTLFPINVERIDINDEN